MERLVKNYATSLIGLVILIFAMYGVISKTFTATEASGWVTTALLFLRSKDSIINLPK